jgi:hypothetical protein
MQKEELEHHYVFNRKSAADIALEYKFSTSKVNYWLDKHKIQKRTISEGIYFKKNPKGDPFNFKPPVNIEEAILFGLGIGLFWGEGNKRNKHSVKLGNTDPKLIRMFIRFLMTIFDVNESKLRFGIQVFNDSDPRKALQFWVKELGFSKKHYLPTLTVSTVRGPGTYLHKSKYGVLTVYFNNMKLKKKIMQLIENIG